MPPKARWIELQNNAKQPTIGKLIDDAMDQIERENPSLKGILPKTYARPDLDKTRLGELIDLIGTLTLKSATPFFFCRGLDEVHKSVNLESMKRITFYTTASGRCPVQEHFDTLPDKTVQKIAWVLRVVRDLEHVPSQYLKKLVNTNDIWEVRVDVGRNTFRVLGFFCGCELIVLTNSFQKKTQKTPQGEVSLAEERKADYLQRRKHHG